MLLYHSITTCVMCVPTNLKFRVLTTVCILFHSSVNEHYWSSTEPGSAFLPAESVSSSVNHCWFTSLWIRPESNAELLIPASETYEDWLQWQTCNIASYLQSIKFRPRRTVKVHRGKFQQGGWQVVADLTNLKAFKFIFHVNFNQGL